MWGVGIQTRDYTSVGTNPLSCWSKVCLNLTRTAYTHLPPHPIHTYHYTYHPTPTHLPPDPTTLSIPPYHTHHPTTPHLPRHPTTLTIPPNQTHHPTTLTTPLHHTYHPYPTTLTIPPHSIPFNTFLYDNIVCVRNFKIDSNLSLFFV